MQTDRAGFFETILGTKQMSRIRRNHGLEHATLHILSQRFPKLSMAGHSNASGFWLIGDVPTEEIESAAHEALERMRAGEHRLAIHPNCGTNFVTSGVMAGIAGAMAMFGAGRRWRDKMERLPLAASMATLALILAQPLGMKFQEHLTTDGVPGSLEISQITPSRRGRLTAHRITTTG